MFNPSDSSDCKGHPLPHRRPQQLHEPHHLRGRKRKGKFYKKLPKKVYHFSERSRLTRYASTNTTRIHFSSRQKTQRLQNCKFAKKNKSAKIAKITKMATKYNNHKKGQMQKISGSTFPAGKKHKDCRIANLQKKMQICKKNCKFAKNRPNHKNINEIQ